MNKSEYLYILSQRISSLPKEEYDNIMEYYSEYFDEAGVENEQSVIEELGSPESLSDKIMQDYSGKGGSDNQNVNGNQYRSDNQNVNGNEYGSGSQYADGNQYGYNNQFNVNQQEKMSRGTKMVIAICTFPFWIGIVAGIFGVIVGFSVASLGCFLAGVAVVVAGLTLITTSWATTLVFAGAGFISIAVALAFLLAVVGMCTGVKKVYSCLFEKVNSQMA